MPVRIPAGPRRPRRGAVSIFFAVCLIALLSVVALVLDGGRLLEERRHAQATSDAAALAAASDLYDWYWSYSGDDPDGTALASALETARANGYTNDTTNSTVTVNIPPASGYYEGKRGYVEVIVEYKVSRSFSNIFSSGPITVRTRSVALGAPVAADVGILVLDPDGRAVFNAQGGGVTTVTGTPVIVNSTNDSATIAGGGGTIKAEKFILSGGYDTSGGGTLDGPIISGRLPTLDPLSYLPEPDPNTMVVQSNKQLHYTDGIMTLQPGVYKGGITVSGTGSLTLQPGIYYMDGGGFSFSGQGSLTGLGVMIYNDPRPGQADGISVTGQGAITLTPMTTGIYAGITFFQDRESSTTGDIAGSGATTVGGVSTTILGTFYFAGAQLNVTGNGGVVNLGSQYISKSLNISGNGNILINWDPPSVARKRSIYLVE